MTISNVTPIAQAWLVSSETTAIGIFQTLPMLICGGCKRSSKKILGGVRTLRRIIKIKTKNQYDTERNRKSELHFEAEV